MGETLKLPIIDLSSTDRLSTATTIRRACVDFGFFYLANHGVEEEFLKRVFEESKMLFSLPLEQKMKLARKENRGYSPFYAEKLDTSLNSRGDLKESFHIGPIEGTTTLTNLNQWPSEGELAVSNEETYGASAHSDYGMITLLATDGVRGLQICREKYRQPQVWEDVQHVNGAFIVNIGDMMERWTNCLFRSTLHRVIPAGQERYSVAFFLDPNSDCMIECLESCCSEKFPPRFPPIRSGDYLQERFRVTYSSQ
ncbi:probable iron/ascorbate oxidoreductase DDB_G0283291 isoform X5 [Telopea speciosissima]|uniref:probable iron/ascorbate oxidoreductase DDB_G0283291 isoform X5 n=1 Tax=Telopea speciosissima TaxID=54955 RepID=UPI001CC40EEC|nr:probable iron/ascorbate oxidoreductase DDB_G0283291 isoform X5 [Telopea speciosissima]